VICTVRRATASCHFLPYDSTVVDCLTAPVELAPVAGHRPLYADMSISAIPGPEGSRLWGGSMSTRIYNGIEWLRERGSWPLLAAIILLSTVTMLLIDDEGMARPVTLVALALLGVALVLGCLFAFPYAGVWHDAATGEGVAEAAGTAPPRDAAFINDIRTMLISIVVGVFALVTIYLTYVSAQAAAQSAEATREQQKFDRLSSSAELLGSNNAGIRLVGVASLSKGPSCTLPTSTTPSWARRTSTPRTPAR
jgi:hypothetical protein